MIVRIMGSGQYEIDDDYKERLNRIDDMLVEVVRKGDKEIFYSKFTELIDLVKGTGTKIGRDKEMEHSDIILPPMDTSFEEARLVFKGHKGLIE